MQRATIPRTGRRAAKRTRHRNLGAVTVEFAFAAPILLLLFFGACEFARVNMLRHTLANAAYEGSRRGIVPGATSANVQSAAQAVLNATSANGATITVSPTTITDNTAQVSTTVSLSMASNSWIVPKWFSGKTLTSTSLLNREQYNSSP